MSDFTATLPNWAIYLLVAPILIFAIWHLNSALLPPPPPPAQLRNAKIVLLIAHPDDESMFFSPTLTHLTQSNLGNHIKILCLSTGNSEGIGELRRKELETAALKLGLRAKEDVLVLDDARFQDGMREQWDTKEISKLLASAFAPDAMQDEKNRAKKKSDGPKATIDAIVTFDAHGVSSHANHIALYHGAKLFLEDLMRGYGGYACPINLYTLQTVNILRKYSFVLDVLPTYFTGIVLDVVAGASGKRKVKSKGISKRSKGDRIMFVSDLGKYWRGRDAMVNAHKSQMVWFRWGWISIGRYMVVNDLKREDV